jgi:hypothetical protein
MVHPGEPESYTNPGDRSTMRCRVERPCATLRGPRRIALGSDAYGAIHKALTDRLTVLEAQREVAFSTDFPK